VPERLDVVEGAVSGERSEARWSSLRRAILEALGR